MVACASAADHPWSIGRESPKPRRVISSVFVGKWPAIFGRKISSSCKGHGLRLGCQCRRLRGRRLGLALCHGGRLLDDHRRGKIRLLRRRAERSTRRRTAAPPRRWPERPTLRRQIEDPAHRWAAGPWAHPCTSAESAALAGREHADCALDKGEAVPARISAEERGGREREAGSRAVPLYAPRAAWSAHLAGRRAGWLTRRLAHQ